MAILAPKFDDRTAHEISGEVRAFLASSHWPQPQSQGCEEALIRVFARFSELILHRLNQAPEKNMLAFLDLLGLSQLPMQAACVPITFLMAPGSAVPARVPAATQVSASPPAGQQKPVVFETDRELIVTPAQLDSLFVKFGRQDLYKDLAAALPPASSDQIAVQNEGTAISTAEALPIPHAFYIAAPVSPSWPKIDRLRLRFTLADKSSAAADTRTMQWESPAADDPPRTTPNAPASQAPRLAPAITALKPLEDGTKNLTQTGEVVFDNPPLTISFALNGISGHWIGCRLLTPISAGRQEEKGMVRASQLPTIHQITCQMELTRQGLATEQAFLNRQKLDISKDFFPFGERPKFGDVFYIANREAFSDFDAEITLHAEITNTGSAADVGIAPARANNTQLSWEFWNGNAWASLGRVRFLRVEGEPAANEFTDQTNSLTQNGDVKFKFPSPPQESIVNGEKNYWIRVRIAGGNYGEEARLAGAVVQPATLAPPSIKLIKIDYTVKKEAAPETLLTSNDFTYARKIPGQPFQPFLPVASDDDLSIYFGFAVDRAANAKQSSEPTSAPPNRGRFPNQPVTSYVCSGDSASQKSGTPAEASTATWEYWNGAAYQNLQVHDETRGLFRSGLLQFIPPLNFGLRSEFRRERYWLRMRLHALDFTLALRHVFLNTITATQGLSVANDILGSSNGNKSQKFTTTQPMVLPGQKLEVREPTLPPEQERRQIQADEGNDAIEKVRDPATRLDHFWVTWREVPNFYASGPRHRHYLIDRVKGEITFGDGQCGLIPPVLPGNVRMRRYRSGGGAMGNLPPQAISKLGSAVAYIQKAINWLPSAGGTDPETDAALLERAPRGIRHNDRAVTYEDFEDLAVLASPDVARARCVPLHDLSVPAAERRTVAGTVSLIVVPCSADPEPAPTSPLLDRVRAYLNRRRLPTADLVVVGPEYVRVDVEAEIAVDDPGVASDVERSVRQELAHYLHPIYGGPDGRGWEFGHLPQKFDLNVRLERIPGVSHVREIRVNTPASAATLRSGNFLISCGKQRIAMVLEEPSATQLA
jgi:predicted phage baseplate assembly protein